MVWSRVALQLDKHESTLHERAEIAQEHVDAAKDAMERATDRVVFDLRWMAAVQARSAGSDDGK